MNFNSIIGQKEVVQSLKGLVASNRTGHAYIFVGPEGIGKRTVAEIFASMLLCLGPHEGNSCGECIPCRLLDNGSDPDFKLIDTENASIGIDEIRELQSDIIARPLYSKRKIYIISGAEKMTVQAQNCLLKTLEEPPAYAVIILTTSSYDSLVETIRSRASKYTFKKNTPQEIELALRSKLGNQIAGIDFIVTYSDGVIGNAYKMADTGEFLPLREKVLDILLRVQESNLLYIFEAYEFFDAQKDNIVAILNIISMFYRDLLVAKTTQIENILINSDKKDIILSNAHRFSERKLLKNIEAVEQALRAVKQNANYQLAMEVMLMKLQEVSI